MLIPRQGGYVQAVGYGAYQKVQAETSSPGELVVLLYDALLKNLRRAVAALEAGESERVNEALTRAQDITLELRAGLDADAELAQELSPLYTFLFRSLVEANVTKDAALVLKLHEIIAPMRDAWVFAVRGETPSTGASGG